MNCGSELNGVACQEVALPVLRENRPGFLKSWCPRPIVECTVEIVPHWKRWRLVPAPRSVVDCHFDLRGTRIRTTGGYWHADHVCISRRQSHSRHRTENHGQPCGNHGEIDGNGP